MIIDDHDRGEEEHGTVAETLFAAATDVAGTGALQAIPSGKMAMVVQDKDRWRERPWDFERCWAAATTTLKEMIHYSISNGAQYLTLHNSFSHPSFSYLLFGNSMHKTRV